MSEQILIVAGAVAVAIAYVLSGRLARARAWRQQAGALAESWGQPMRGDRSERPVSARTPAQAPAGCDRLDDATWSDLDMDRVLGRVDRTLSAFGAQYLHRALRCPLLDVAALDRRRALARDLAADAELRVRLQRALVAVGDRRGWEAASALAGSLPQLPGPLWLLRLALPTLVALLTIGIAVPSGLALTLGMFGALALPLVHTLASRTIGPHIQAVSDVHAAVECATQLRRALPVALARRLDPVLDELATLRRALGRTVEAADPGRIGAVSELATEYARAYALLDLIRYQRNRAAIERHRDEIDRVLDAIGEIDVALAIAYLHAHEPGVVAPELDAGLAELRVVDLRHPLVRDAVGNDVTLGPRGLLVTGSNMAGKSTLLRALGVGAVLAQSLGLVWATSWRSPPLRVATAMGAHDDLGAGVSLFRAEIDRVRTLVERAGGRGLFLLDEAFRGTNPHERIAASAAVLRHLVANDLVAAATHDRELCPLLADAFVLGHFTEAVAEHDVVFDYRLHPGVLQSTNAIALLERVGYPATLVAEARRIARELE